MIVWTNRIKGKYCNEMKKSKACQIGSAEQYIYDSPSLRIIVNISKPRLEELKFKSTTMNNLPKTRQLHSALVLRNSYGHHPNS